MRNLKKILALVLALVMSMSLLATANAFNDDAEIDATYDEAVTVLANLKVFQGYNNGETFVPKGSITRAEVAAILYRIATGDVDDSQVDIYANYNKFDDVKSTSWYAGYVNYCANAEYIKGYDDKTFGPNDPVTGYQALAMILRAVGYDANDEFTGTSWQVKVASTANQLGITRNITAGTLGTAATREVVAEILFRTIAEAYIVEWTTAFGYQPVYLPGSMNQVQGIPLFGNITMATLGGQTFGLAKTTGEISKVARTTDQVTLTTYGTTAVPAAAVATDKTIYDAVDSDIVVGTGADWTKIGYQAYVYTVPTPGAKTLTAVSDLVVTGTSLEVNTDRAGISSSKTADDAGVRYYYNGELITEAEYRAGTIGGTTNIAQLLKTRGVKVDVIDNDNLGKYETVVITQYTVAKVTGIATDSTTTGSNAVAANTYYFTTDVGNVVAVANSKLVTSDTLAVGDWVTFVEYPNSRVTAQGDYYVTKAPVATGVLTKIVEKYNPADATYTLGGADYVKSDITTQQLVNSLNRYGQGRNYQFYTDPYGYIIVADYVQVNDYLFVYANDVTSTVTGLTPAKVVLADGSVASINVKTVNSIPTVWNQTVYGVNELATVNTDNLYSYTVNADGTYNLNSVAARIVDAPYTKGNVWWGDAGVDTASAVVDVRLMNDATTSNPVYTGYSNIPTMVNVLLYYVPAADRDIKVGFLTNGEADNTTEIFVYQTSEVSFDYNFGENTGHAYMDVYVDGVKVEDCALTSEQYEDIRHYGVGIYTYYGDDLVYSSFDEQWGAVTWNNGQVLFAYNGEVHRFAYNEVNLSVLDITKGTAINLGLVNSGNDYYNGTLLSGQRAIIRLDESGKTASIYFIVGNLANTAFEYGLATQDKNDAWYTYAVANNYITKVIEIAPYGLNVTFYGEDDYTTDATGVRTITVDYAAAVDAESPLVIDFGNQVSLVDGQNSPIAAIPSVPVVGGASYGLVVYDNAGNQYSYKLVLNPAAVGTDLFCNGTKVTSPYNYTTATTFDNMVKDFTPSTGAKISWKFYDGAGREIAPNMNTTIDSDYVAVATVTAEAESGVTAEYWVYFDGTAPTADEQTAIIVTRIQDKTSATEVAAAVAKIKAAGEGFTKAATALDNAGVPTNVLVPAMMDAWAAASTAADPHFSNAGLVGKLVEVLVTDLDDAEALVNAYLGWLANELKVATGSSIVNNCGLTINQTATGWAIDFTSAVVTMNDPATGGIKSKAITNSGLNGLSTKLLEKLGGGYEVEIKWPGMIQDGSVGDFVAQWNTMQSAVLGGTSFTLTVTIYEKAAPSNTTAFQVVLG